MKVMIIVTDTQSTSIQTDMRSHILLDNKHICTRTRTHKFAMISILCGRWFAYSIGSMRYTLIAKLA